MFTKISGQHATVVGEEFQCRQDLVRVQSHYLYKTIILYIYMYMHVWYQPVFLVVAHSCTMCKLQDGIAISVATLL